MPREMVERGDWLTPRLNYLDYVEKPPLPYWATCVSYKVFGVSEASARLPLALFTIAALAATAWLGSWLFSLEVGLAAAVMLGTSIQFLALSRLLTPDLPLTAALAWTVAFWLRALLRPADAAWAGTAAGACMGMAVLCKGLIGLVFPAGWALGAALLVPELRRGLARSIFRSGLIPAFLLVGVPWFWAMERRHPGFLAFFIGEQHFQRFMAGASKYKRPGGWHYFIPVELVGALPWTPLALAALGSLAARWRTADAGSRALGLWIAGVFGFFTVSSSKLPTYITPLFPQQCLLAAALLFRLEEDKRAAGWTRGLAWGLGGILGLAIPALPLALSRVEGAPLPAAAAPLAAGVLAATAAGTLVLAMRKSRFDRLLGAAAGAAAAILLGLAGARVAEPWLSCRPIAAAINERFRAGDAILSYGVYLHGIPFYTGRPVDVVNWVGELHYAKRDPANKGRFGDDTTIRELPRAEGATFVTLRRKESTWFAGLSDPGEMTEMRSFGTWALARFEKKGEAIPPAGPKGSPRSGDGLSPGR